MPAPPCSLVPWAVPGALPAPPAPPMELCNGAQAACYPPVPGALPTPPAPPMELCNGEQAACYPPPAAQHAGAPMPALLLARPPAPLVICPTQHAKDVEAGRAAKQPALTTAAAAGEVAGRGASDGAGSSAPARVPMCGARWWARHYEAAIGAAMGVALVLALVTCTLEFGVMGTQASVPLPVISGVTPGTPDAALDLPQLLPNFTAAGAAGFGPAGVEGAAAGADGAAARAIAQEASPMQRASLGALLTFYDPSTGLFTKSGWWNNANTFEALIDYALLSDSSRDAISVMLQVAHDKNGVASFFNNYLDDQGWWGITWARAYQMTGESQYLQTAEKLFDNMAAGWTDACGGGVLWKKTSDFKATISTQLYMQLAMLLQGLEPDPQRSSAYLAAAEKGWEYLSTKLLHEDGTFDDGLNGSCAPHTGIMYSYNQGVVLGGLLQLAAATTRPELIDTAKRIADAALRTLGDANGVLREKCEPECTSDGAQFKGIFIRYLYKLYRVTREPRYRDFIIANARSAWMQARDTATNLVGVSWAGPYVHRGGQAAVTQTAALDLFNALQGIKTDW